MTFLLSRNLEVEPIPRGVAGNKSLWSLNMLSYISLRGVFVSSSVFFVYFRLVYVNSDLDSNQMAARISLSMFTPNTQMSLAAKMSEDARRSEGQAAEACGVAWSKENDVGSTEERMSGRPPSSFHDKKQNGRYLLFSNLQTFIMYQVTLMSSVECTFVIDTMSYPFLGNLTAKGKAEGGL